MIRECSLEEISDGRTYRENDMVKADTAGCDGCFKCCTGMGNSIILDPYDIWLLKNFSEGAKLTFEQLLATGNVELNIVDGLILPNLSMKAQDRCAYLDADGGAGFMMCDRESVGCSRLEESMMTREISLISCRQANVPRRTLRRSR